jgi:Zn-dependent protease with chaperone function
MTLPFAIVGLLVFSVALFGTAGAVVRARAAGRRGRVSPLLYRMSRRCAILLLLATGLVLLVVDPPRMSPFARALLIYLGPLALFETWVLGTSWLEIRARGISSGLWRFHRFNLFTTWMLYGQRLPFLCAAVAAPADLSRAAVLLPNIVLHLLIAMVLWASIRRFVETWLLPVTEIRDEGLLADLHTVAAGEGIRLGAVRLVATERGQSVNAIAATSSGSIYVAEGLRDGLDREELKAVLLHEVAHLGQKKTNVFRDVTAFCWPAAIWVARGVPGLALSRTLSFAIVAGVIGAALLWDALVRTVDEQAERRADRFADRLGTPGALASALAKMYARDLRRRGLAERLREVNDRATVS